MLAHVMHKPNGAQISEHSALSCAQGQVLSLASAGEFLFSGGQEGAVAVWKFDQTTQMFVSAVISPTNETAHLAMRHFQMCVA